MNHLLIISPDAQYYLDQLNEFKLPELEIAIARSTEEAEDRIQECNIILGRPPLVGPILGKARKLTWMQSLAAGIELLIEPGMRQDYILTGVKGVFGLQISEYVFGYMLTLERSIIKTLENQRKISWEKIPFRRLQDLTLGIFGFGSIGEDIARIAHNFNMRVVAYRRHPGDHELAERVFSGDELDEFLGQVDYLVLALPDTPGTDGLINKEALASMKPSAVLINIGRGNVVVETDLANALAQQVIRAAVLDVFEEEPLPPNSPLWRLSNAYLTPHNAAFGFQEPLIKLFCENYQRFINQQELLYKIDFERGY
jgi:phosphoglycerate dehydrogenase-like enzyme